MGSHTRAAGSPSPLTGRGRGWGELDPSEQFLRTQHCRRIQLVFPLRVTPTHSTPPRKGEGGSVGVRCYRQRHSRRRRGSTPPCRQGALSISRCCWPSSRSPLPRFRPRRRAGRDAEGPRAGGARAPHLAGAALPRVPEPVDRRQQRRACPRPARAGARAPRRRRQRRRRTGASSRPATASSCCCARPSSRTRSCCGWRRSCCSPAPPSPSSAAPASHRPAGAAGPDAAPLSPAEQQRLDDLLKKTGA